jgi:hypothetical protein
MGTQCVVCTKDAHCPAGQICKSLGNTSTCVPGCTDDTRCAGLKTATCCNGQCTDTSTDAQNCGACGMGCMSNNASAACVGGACTAGACRPGWGDCNGNALDGCEVNTNTSSANCGACNKACPANQSCNAGACGGCDPTTDVSYLGHCYYLDGSGGHCDTGYALVSQSILTSIAASFVGKTYKHTVSANCCIQNADAVENWGFPYPGQCNVAGPFAVAPFLGGASCTGVVGVDPKQLTLCGK